MHLITPHENQIRILQGRKRFNHVKCGRRFGKTIFLNILFARAFINTDKFGNKLEPFKIGVWFPVYKDLEKVWQKIKYDFHEAIESKSESLKQIRTTVGGEIDFWSMENPDSGRGMDYDRAILDEFAKAGKNKEAWQNAIRPTLTDRSGDAWIFSTPKGKSNYFFQMQLDHVGADNWAFWKFTSYDNPYLDPKEIDEAKNQLDKITFRQEYMADDVDANEKPFLYSFNEEVHVTDGLTIDERLPVWLSFDFNVIPQTVVIGQRKSNDELHIIDLLRLDNASTYDVCDRIKVKFPYYLTVTGDATGRNRSSTNNISNWAIIRKELNLRDPQIKIRRKNLDHRNSQVICNSVLEHKTIRINGNLKELLDDITFAATDENGKLIKNPDRGLHFFDGLRYLLDANFPDVLKIK